MILKTSLSSLILTLSFVFTWLTPTQSVAQSFTNFVEKDLQTVTQLWEKLPKNNTSADDLLKYLMNTGNYENILIYKSNGGKYHFVAEKIRKISSVSIKGEDEVGETDILNALGLKKGTAVDEQRLQRGIEQLRELYGKNGFFNPEFKVDINKETENEFGVVLTIKENEPTTVQEVTIITENNSLSKKLKAITKKIEGKNFSDSRLRDFEARIRTYLRDERYLNARFIQKEARYNQSKTQAFLSYELLSPYYFRIEIDGNDDYTHADLMRAIDIDNFDRTSLNPAAEISDRIRLYYINNGYAFVKVNFDTNTTSNDFVRFINIKVNEGQRINISKIDITGRISRPQDFYVDFILENSSDNVKDGYYVKEDLELGYRNLATTLKNEGYLKAKILSARADFDNEKNNVLVNVLLDEGALTTVSEFNMTGNKSFGQEDLTRIIGLKKGSALRLNRLESGLNEVIDNYKANGFIEARIVTPEKDILKYDQDEAQASVNLEIYEGPKVFIRNIIVEGNNFTKDYVLLKQSEFEVGELLTPDKIENARKRLQALDIFSRVEIRTLESNTMTSQRALIISVTEKNPGSFRIGFGLNTRQNITARGFSGITYSNLFGTARAVSLRGTLENNLDNEDLRSYDVSLGYLEPFLFGTSIRGRVALSRQVSITENATEEDLDGETIDRLAFFTEKDFGQNIRFIWNTWSLESIQTYKEPSDGKGARTRVATIGPILDLDYRDNPFLPTGGHFTRFEADYSSPAFGSSELIHFIRTQATFSFYKDLYKKKWIWANSIRGGYAKNINTKIGSGIPESYGFFLGGYTTVRGFSGFDEDRVPPDSILGVSPDNQLIIPDETSYRLFKSELRFPISGILGGVLFYDAGAVEVTNKTFTDVSGVRDRTFEAESVGIGFRVNTPVGPLSLDYGRKIDPEHNKDQKDQIHLSIGTF